MKNFKAHFEAMHAAADGNMEPAKKLFRPKSGAEKAAPRPASSPKNWFAEFEEKQEKETEKFGNSRNTPETH